MADTRISSTAVISPQAALEALGFVDPSDHADSGPSPGPSGSSSMPHPHPHPLLARSTAGNAASVAFASTGLAASTLASATAGSAIAAAGGSSLAHTANLSHLSHTHPHGAIQHHAQDPSGEALGFPANAQVVRVPEGQRYRVRAVYDFDATDESALSFRAGDIIEVLTMLPSGWWDGMLGANRGWFPSNYVEDFDDADLYENDYALEMAPDGSIIHRNPEAAADILGLDESLARGWSGWGGDAMSTSLDDLALELMHSTSLGGGHPSSLDHAGPPQVQAANRSMDPHRPNRRSLTADPDETLHAMPRTSREIVDAWVPSLTNDGRVFYQNTQTGERSWELPEGPPQELHTFNSRPSSTHGDDYGEPPQRRGSGRPSSYDFSRDPRAQGARKASDVSSKGGASFAMSSLPHDGFRIPPNLVHGGVPYPWAARLSDDGRVWFFVNQVTGETRRDPPHAATLRVDGVPPRRASVGATGQPAGRPQTHRRTQTEWEERIRTAVAPLYAPPPRLSMDALITGVNNAVADVYEAALAGAAAEEEIAVARSIQDGLADAMAHDEAATERMAVAREGIINAVHDLIVAFGYVGPIIASPQGLDSQILNDTMIRPKWASDMSLVGSLGLLSITIHTAITAPRVSEPGTSIWGDVMRAATKFRGVVEAFPGLVLGDAPDRGNVTGRPLIAWFGADTVSDFMSGRFGFGPAIDTVQRPLDQSAVIEVQKLKAEVDAFVRVAGTAGEDGLLEILRALTRFRDAVLHIDVAVAIDLDGEDASASTQTGEHHAEDARVYADLVSRARTALRDLDEAVLALDEASADLYLRSDSESPASSSTSPAYESISQGVSAVFRAFSSLLMVSQQQTASIDQGIVRGNLGARSSTAAARRAAVAAARARTYSNASFDSTRSRRSEVQRVQADHKRNASMASSADSHPSRTTASETEFLDQDEGRASSDQRPSSARRESRASHSASASQTSLSTSTKRGGDASSSQTSLAFQPESSESGSMRGSNRASILKAVPSFLRQHRGDDSAKSKVGRAREKMNREVARRDSMLPPTPATPIAPSQPPPMAPIRPPPAWDLESDTPPGELVLDDKGAVKYGTIRALVERLTPHGSSDTSFFQAFLLTYRSFVTTEELFALLIERFNVAPPPDLTPEQLREWEARKQTPIRLRVANTFKAWLDHHYVEKRDQNMLDTVADFAAMLKTVKTVGMQMLSGQLMLSVERRRRGEPDLTKTRRGGVPTSGPPPPIPLAPKTTGKPMQLLDIPPLEIARQWTLVDFDLFQAIKPAECLHKAWTKEDKAERAPGLVKAIANTNRVGRLVTAHILRFRDIKARATAIKHWINVAMEARALNNFSTMASITGGLSTAAISRLKRTWEQLSEKTLRDWQVLEGTLDSSKNFARYKDHLKSINPPCVPFFGFYLTLLTFIEDGNKDMVVAPGASNASLPLSPSASQQSMHPSISAMSTISSVPSAATSTAVASSNASSTATSVTAATANGNGNTNGNAEPSADATPIATTQPLMLINFFKRSLTAEIIRDIQQYQAIGYNLTQAKTIAAFLEESIDEAMEDSRDLYDVSKAIEPKAPATEEARYGRRI